MLVENMVDLIGNTPLLHLKNYQEKKQLKANLYGKLEWFNPSGSVKDRTAKEMIFQAEQSQKLHPGDTIIEATSGNMGIALSAIGVAKGYPVIIVMPESASIERKKKIASYGASLVLTDAKEGMKGAIRKAEELHRHLPKSMVMHQFSNPANVLAHKKGTAHELLRDLNPIDIVVIGVGSGGTITGVGEVLKEKNPKIQIVAVEPFSSAVLSKKEPGKHHIEGIGAGFVPEILNTDIYDEVIAVKDEDAYQEAKMLMKTEGISAGVSSGAALWAAKQVALRKQNTEKNVVVVFPDDSAKYFSTELFDA